MPKQYQLNCIFSWHKNHFEDSDRIITDYFLPLPNFPYTTHSQICLEQSQHTHENYTKVYKIDMFDGIRVHFFRSIVHKFF